MRVRALISVVLILGVQAALAEPPPIVMPDVRANVMQMLQQAKEQGTAVVVETEILVDDEPVTVDTLQDVDGEPTTAEDLFEQARRQRLGRQGGGEPEVKATAMKGTNAASEPKEGAAEGEPSRHEHLSLPNKVITIKDLQDIQQLSDEFDEAKRRKQ